jgi:hypothetical protein
VLVVDPVLVPVPVPGRTVCVPPDWVCDVSLADVDEPPEVVDAVES